MRKNRRRRSCPKRRGGGPHSKYVRRKKSRRYSKTSLAALACDSAFSSNSRNVHERSPQTAGEGARRRGVRRKAHPPRRHARRIRTRGIALRRAGGEAGPQSGPDLRNRWRIRATDALSTARFAAECEGDRRDACAYPCDACRRREHGGIARLRERRPLDAIRQSGRRGCMRRFRGVRPARRNTAAGFAFGHALIARTGRVSSVGTGNIGFRVRVGA